jgi:autotransporter-associated beta strand protein
MFLPIIKLLLIAVSLFLGVAIQAQGVFDTGATAPTPGTYDISQLTGGHDNGGGYYVDSGNPGQSITTLSTRSTYPLTTIYIKTRSSGAGGGQPGLSAYTLRIYSMTNATGATVAAIGTATLISTYITTNQATFTQGDWLKFAGLTNILQAGTNYGFALSRNGSGYWEPDNSGSDVLAGGIAMRFPTATGASPGVYPASDMTFDMVLSMTVGTTTFSPISPVYVGTPVTLSATVFGGKSPFTYDWQQSTDGGVTFSDLVTGNGNPAYNLDTTGMGGTTNYYRLIVSDSEGNPIIATNTAAALFVSSTPLPPIVVSNLTITPSSVYANLSNSVTMTAPIGGTPTLYYQWQYTNNNGGSLISIPSATNATYTIPNPQHSDAGSYRLVITNASGATNTSFASLTVLSPVIISDFGATAPAPNINGFDIAQLSNAGTTVNPAGLYSYDDHATAPGQTFTTGSNVGGYSLASLFIKFGVSGNSGNAAGLVYTLRIFSLTNAYSGTATLLTTYTNQNIAPAFAAAGGHWCQWFGNITNVFAANMVYGYSLQQSSGYMMQDNNSGNPYLGGQQVNLPTATGAGTFGTAGVASNYDMAFMMSVVPAGGYPGVQSVSMSQSGAALTNGSTVFAGAPVTLNVGAFGSNIGYIWQTDNQTGGSSFSPLPNSNTSQYSLDTSAFTPGTYQLNVLVTNSIATNTSMSLTLVVQAAVIQSVSIAPVNNSSNNPVYVGTPVTLSATVQGTNLTYYWQTDGAGGGSLTNIPNSNTNVFTFDTSAMPAGTYLYDLMVSNASGTVTSSQLTLNLVAASGPVIASGITFTPSAVAMVGNGVTMSGTFNGSQPITYQWQHAGTNIPSATANSYNIPATALTDAGTYTLIASNTPPGIGPITASNQGLLYVVPAAINNTTAAKISDGGTAPIIGSYDVSQTTFTGASGPTTINYYVDATSPPGVVFTTGNTPPTGAGYPLNYVYFKQDSTGGGAGNTVNQAYTLYVYQMLDGTNAQLLTSYVTTNTTTIANDDWIRLDGLTNILAVNTSYAFSLHRNSSGYYRLATQISGSPFTGGQSAVAIPTSGGIAVSGSDTLGDYYDAAFVAGLTPPVAPVELTPMTIVPSSVYAGQGPVAMTALFSGSQPITYQWQVDTGSGYVNILGATNTSYVISTVNVTNAGTYICLASNSLSAGVPTPSTAQALTVNATPATLVANYVFTSYSGAGVVGSGTYWNALDATSTNQTSSADDGSIPASFGIGIGTEYTFTGPTAGISLFNKYLLIQDNTLRNFTCSDLIPGVYNVVLYSGNAYHGSKASFSIGSVTNGVTNTVDNAFVRGNNYVLFTNVVATNTISGLWGRPAGSGNDASLNGLQLQMAWPLSNPHMFIVFQPTNTTVPVGYPASVSLLAEGPDVNGLPGSVFYQWYDSNNNPVSGATNSPYAPNTSAASINTYYCIVTNLTGLSITSASATVTVVQPDTLVWLGSAGDAWDINNTANWNDITSAASPVTYADPNVVRFDDSASDFNVNNAVTVAPSSVTVSNNANNYVLYGSGSISGLGSLTKAGTGMLTISNNQAYTGGTIVNGGMLVLAKGGAAGSVNGTVTANPGTTVSLTTGDALGYTGNHVTVLNLNGAAMDNATIANNSYATTWNLMGGSMTSSGGGAYNIDAATGYSINSLATNITSTISGNIAMRSQGLNINTAQGTVPSGTDLSIYGNMTDGGGNTVIKNGNGTLSLSGVNTFNGDITINAGTLRIDGAGVLNSGNYTAQIHNNGTLFSYNSSAAQTLGVISGSGLVTLNGIGSLTLNSLNTDTNLTTVNSGTLTGTGTIAGPLTVNSGGMLVPGSGGAGALTVNGNLVLNGGSTSSFTVNGSTPANTAIALGNSVTYGGVLSILPAGTFTSGQSFTLFSGAGATSASNFSSISGSPGSGLTFAFSNGVLSVVGSDPSGPAHLTNSVSGGMLSLTWPAGQGWRLISTTNSLAVGLTPGTNGWSTVTVSTDGSFTITPNTAAPTVFYKLIYP